MMLIIWTFLLLTSISCYGVTETQEETENITTLYPVSKNATNDASPTNRSDSLKTGNTLSETLNKDEDSNNTESKEEPVIEKPGNDSKEFKPSINFQNFFDEDDFGIVPLPTKPTVDSFTPLKKPPSAFIGSHKDAFKSIKSKPPIERFPYKFEDAILTRAKSKWRSTPSLESRPTDPVPAQVPAGGLYKKPDPFKDKPYDEEFGLTFNDDKENVIKKRPNSWKGLLHLLTAFIPVGLIISALTPNVITIHSTGPGAGPGLSGVHEPLPPRLFRRSDELLDPLPPPPAAPLPTISEPCRRRLLCELHSEKNYHNDQRKRPDMFRALCACAAGGQTIQTSRPLSAKQHGQLSLKKGSIRARNMSGRFLTIFTVPRRGRACYKLRCDDPGALAQVLQYLMQRPPGYNRFT